MKLSELTSTLNTRHKAVIRGDGQTAVRQLVMGSMAVDREARMVSGMVTTATKPGLDGLVVPASAFDLSYFWGDPMNGIPGLKTVYWNHDTETPIGTCQALAMRKNGEALFARTYVSRTPLGEDVLTMLEEGVVRGFSCGFRINEMTAPTGPEVQRWPDAEYVVRSALLLEYSIVSQPADPGSQVMADPERAYSDTERLVTRGKVSRAVAERLGMLPAKGRTPGVRSLIEVLPSRIQVV